jgi:hypothetical protein
MSLRLKYTEKVGVVVAALGVLAGCALVPAGWGAAPPPKPGRPERNDPQALLYLSDMRQAFLAAQADDTDRVQVLLQLHQPRFGRADQRGWEWYYLQALCRETPLCRRGHAGAVNGVAWSPDGKWLASAGQDGMIKVWDAVTGKEGPALRGGHKSVAALSWSPDGRRLASAAHDRTVKVWEVATGKVREAATGKEVLPPRKGVPLPWFVPFLAWSPDGRRLLWLPGDATVRVDDAVAGKKVLTLKGHTQTVSTAAWAPDGGRLASAGLDKTIKVWDLAKERRRSP